MTSGSDTFLIDTNVLVYAHDPRDVDKQQIALFVLDTLINSNRGVLSVQCLTEFFTVVTRRLPDRMGDEEALNQIERLIRACRVLDLTAQVVLEGCRGVVHHQLSVWDSFIWSVAKLNQIDYILTEDAQHGRFLEGVYYINPFAEEFDVTLVDGN